MNVVMGTQIKCDCNQHIFQFFIFRFTALFFISWVAKENISWDHVVIVKNVY
jgi:hypothetical protein